MADVYPTVVPKSGSMVIKPGYLDSSLSSFLPTCSMPLGKWLNFSGSGKRWASTLDNYHDNDYRSLYKTFPLRHHLSRANMEKRSSLTPPREKAPITGTETPALTGLVCRPAGKALSQREGLCPFSQDSATEQSLHRSPSVSKPHIFLVAISSSRPWRLFPSHSCLQPFHQCKQPRAVSAPAPGWG